MLIHSSDLHHITGCLWEYHSHVFGNRVVIPFTTKIGEKPQTGDKIENNQLVKGGALA